MAKGQVHWELMVAKFKGKSLGVSQSNPWDEGQLSRHGCPVDDAQPEKDLI